MSCLAEKTIEELLEYSFFIPANQIGYGWIERQLTELLEGVNTFKPTRIEGTDKITWYCMRPIIVKEFGETDKQKLKLSGKWYEVLDGQQQLTSISLIIRYANEIWIGEEKSHTFKIKFGIRDSNSEFLQHQKIYQIINEVNIDYDCINFSYISEAFITFHKWVKNQTQDFNIPNFLCKFKNYSKVIWYEVTSEKDSDNLILKVCT